MLLLLLLLFCPGSRHTTVIIRYVNFDQEILQLIREAKCLDRMGIAIPESAKIVLVQEAKFKNYYNDLHYVLKEYRRIVDRVAPVTQKLLATHCRDMDYKLRPGMITLTWTSMNIDAYKHHIHTGLQRLGELVTTINDIIEHRIVHNLKVVSRCMLMDLSMSTIVSLEKFVKCQEAHIDKTSALLQGKNVEIETAVDDLVRVITSFPLEANIAATAKDDSKEIEALRAHYNSNMHVPVLVHARTLARSLARRLLFVRCVCCAVVVVVVGGGGGGCGGHGFAPALLRLAVNAALTCFRPLAHLRAVAPHRSTSRALQKKGTRRC